MPSQLETDFINLLHRNKGTIYKVCWQFCGKDDFLFQEIGQEIHYTLWDTINHNGIRTFESDKQEAAWVYKVAFFAACNYLRQHGNEQYTLSIGNKLLDSQLSEEEESDRERLLDLAEKLNNSTDCRVLEYRLAGYRCAEIAKLEGTTETAITTRISRIIKKLQKIISSQPPSK